jgi:phage baseplate assembly protein W
MASTRWSVVQAGDTLRIIALRELGDALRWIEIANLNDLRPPYIIASLDPNERTRGTLVWGDRLLLPSGTATADVTRYEDLYGTDIDLTAGQLSTDASGDLALVAGGDNLVAALDRRIRTRTGDLPAHPRYGCDVAAILGFKLRPVSLLLGAGFIRAAVRDEPRIASVDNVTANASGDAALYGITARPIGGETPVTLNLVFPWETA